MILDSIKLVIPDTEDLLIDKIDEIDVLCVLLKNETMPIPIIRFGDGTVKIIRILFEMLQAKGQKLMIDEIETGIHWTRQKDFWRYVIQFCAEYKVQLFATTHSLECQKFLIEALQDEDMKQYQADARNISMVEVASGQVETVTFDFDQFEYAVSIGYNTRGGS